MAQPMPPAVPTFSPPDGKKLWELGKQENWPELSAMLNPFDKFYVIDARTEAFSRDNARKFEECRMERNMSIAIHYLLSNEFGGDNPKLLKGMLALGVHPDLPAASGRRPSHFCSMNNRKACAEVLAVCRPDLSAHDKVWDTPVDCSGRGKLIWGNYKMNGFPCLAQLAHDQKWWAVQNLCRRRVVPDDEVTTAYKGKTALQWTEHHGQKSLLAEMQYLLGPQQRLSLVQQKLESEVTSKKRFQKEFEEKLREVQEAVSTCVTGIGEVSGKLEKCVGKEARNITGEDCDKKIKQVEERLLSSVQELEERFNNHFELLKEMVVARESIVEAQLKSIQDEVAKLASSGNSSIGPSGAEAACPQPQQSGTREEASRSSDPKDEMLKEFLALAKKYGA